MIPSLYNWRRGGISLRPVGIVSSLSESKAIKCCKEQITREGDQSESVAS